MKLKGGTREEEDDKKTLAYGLQTSGSLSMLSTIRQLGAASNFGLQI
jgi:hypothetical protein